MSEHAEDDQPIEPSPPESSIWKTGLSVGLVAVLSGVVLTLASVFTIAHL